MKHDDPRIGAVSMTVVQVNRNEPESTLFVVPDGFKPPAAPKQERGR
jgi:hypothetical protein